MHRLSVLRLAVLTTAALGAAACTAAVGPGQGTPIGVIAMNTRSTGSGFTTAPTANFYSATSYSFASSESVVDSCQQALYAPTTLSSSGGGVPIGAGAYMAVSVSGHTDTLWKSASSDWTYSLKFLAGLNFTPGDSITFTLPGDGGGFPGGTVKGRTAEAFTYTPVVVPPSGQGLSLTWTTPTDPRSAMIVQFLFNDPTTTDLNNQIYCEFKDDGAATVRANLISLWTAATVRDIKWERVRTFEATLGTTNYGYLSMISAYDLPLPQSP